MALVLGGTVVPVSLSGSDSFEGRVYIGDDGHIDGVRSSGAKAPTGFAQAPVVDTDAVIYPGLIDLHSHTAYNTLPLWTEKGRVEPWMHHNSWTTADSYHTDVVWPTGVLGYAAGPALLAYIGLKALVGGTTSIQGSVSKPKLTFPWVVRVVENEKIGPLADPLRAAVLTVTDPKKLGPYVDGMNNGQGFIYHCAEGQPGSVVTKEYDAVGTALGLQQNLIAVHCTALTRADFDRWTPKPGTVVWSPFSNLWLYGLTTDVVSATKAGLRVALGSDWSPSGTKHLLGELKVADLHNRQTLGGHFTDRQLVEMVTANPGDALSGPWGLPCGRLVDGGLGDVVVMSRRNASNPWRNMIAATESDVLLTVIDGRARYGTTALMEAAGAAPMGAVSINGESRRASIPRLDRPDEHWPLTEVRADLNRVRSDPAAAVRRARGAAEAWASIAAVSSPEQLPDPPLVVIPDLPTSDTMTAGLPPDASATRIPPLDPLVHDAAFFRRVVANPIHRGQLDGLREYYFGDGH